MAWGLHKRQVQSGDSEIGCRTGGRGRGSWGLENAEKLATWFVVSGAAGTKTVDSHGPKF
jgi:hypothetical protein